MAQARYRRGNGHPAKSPFCSTLGGSPTGIFRTPGSGVLRGPRTPGPLAPPPTGGSRVSGLGSEDLRIWGSGSEVGISRSLDIWRGMTSGLLDICPSRSLAPEGPPRAVAHAASDPGPPGPRSGLQTHIGYVACGEVHRARVGLQGGASRPTGQSTGSIQYLEPPKEVGDDPTPHEMISGPLIPKELREMQHTMDIPRVWLSRCRSMENRAVYGPGVCR